MDFSKLKLTNDNKKEPVNEPPFYKEVIFNGDELIGCEYEPVFDFFKGKIANSHKVLGGDFVTTEDGTGIVHIASGFGEDDFNLCKKNNIGVVCPVDDGGCFEKNNKDLHEIKYKLGDKEETLELRGKQVFETNDDIIKYLKGNNLWVKTEQYLHNYPHCWRTDTPLIYKAVSSWYVKVSDFKDRMCELNKQINWVPEHIRDGQFGKWLENARDWSITRNRFWGAPVPVWRIKYRKHLNLNLEEHIELKEEVLGDVIAKFDELHPELKDDPKKLYNNDYWHLYRIEGEKMVENKIKTAKNETEIELKNLLLKAIKNGCCVKIHPCYQIDNEFDKIIQNEQECLKEICDNIIDFELGDNALEEDLDGNICDVDLEYDFEVIPNSIESLEGYFKDDYVADFKAGKNSGKYIKDKSNPEESFEINDLHRPYIDELIKHTDGGDLKRVDDVLDCWFESGSMPYASVHYPFEYRDGNGNLIRTAEENKKWFAEHFPCDFVTEYVAQTRGWFYTMVVLATALFDKIPFKNVICHGVMLDANGQKLSKRLRNYPDPLEMIDTLGSDAMRWLMASSPVVQGGDMRIDKDGQMIVDVVKNVLNPIWNAFMFYKQYAELDKIVISGEINSKNVMDIYILSKLKIFVQNFEKAMDKYNTIDACIETEKFIDRLNNWYIRRNKDRFWKSEKDNDKQQAYEVLNFVLKNFALTIAPLLPFISETMWRELSSKKYDKKEEC